MQPLTLLITFQIGHMEFVAALDDILIKFLILPVGGGQENLFLSPEPEVTSGSQTAAGTLRPLSSGGGLHTGSSP